MGWGRPYRLRHLAPDRGGYTLPIVSVLLLAIAGAIVVLIFALFMLAVLAVASRADEADWYRSVTMPDLEILVQGSFFVCNDPQAK